MGSDTELPYVDHNGLVLIQTKKKTTPKFRELILFKANWMGVDT